MASGVRSWYAAVPAFLRAASSRPAASPSRFCNFSSSLAASSTPLRGERSAREQGEQAVQPRGLAASPARGGEGARRRACGRAQHPHAPAQHPPERQVHGGDLVDDRHRAAVRRRLALLQTVERKGSGQAAHFSSRRQQEAGAGAPRSEAGRCSGSPLSCLSPLQASPAARRTTRWCTAWPSAARRRPEAPPCPRPCSAAAWAAAAAW